MLIFMPNELLMLIITDNNRMQMLLTYLFIAIAIAISAVPTWIANPNLNAGRS